MDALKLLLEQEKVKIDGEDPWPRAIWWSKRITCFWDEQISFDSKVPHFCSIVISCDILDPHR